MTKTEKIVEEVKAVAETVAENTVNENGNEKAEGKRGRKSTTHADMMKRSNEWRIMDAAHAAWLARPCAGAARR